MGEYFESKFNHGHEAKSESIPLEAHVVVDESMIEDLPRKIDEWFQGFCIENNLNPKNKAIGRIAYYIIELAKNAVQHGSNGYVRVKLIGDSIEVTVQDTGSGFEDPIEDMEFSVGGGYGLKDAMRYANDFSIETKGLKFHKEITRGKPKKLVQTGASETLIGSKVIFVKRIKLPETK